MEGHNVIYEADIYRLVFRQIKRSQGQIATDTGGHNVETIGKHHVSKFCSS